MRTVYRIIERGRQVIIGMFSQSVLRVMVKYCVIALVHFCNVTYEVDRKYVLNFDIIRCNVSKFNGSSVF